MKRRALLSAIGALAAAAVIGVFATRARESVWYHESDVALVASTGRPQFVEFFHPD